MHLHILLTKKREWGGGQNNWLEKDHFAFFFTHEATSTDNFTSSI